MTIEEKRRALFEVRMAQVAEDHQYTSNHGLFKRSDTGDYVHTWVDCAWIGFNAALDAVVIELPRLWISNNSSASEQAAVQTLNACKEAIESTGLGLKVKV